MGDHIVLIGSIVIGALLLLAILNLNSTMTAKSYQQTLDNVLKQDFSTLQSIITEDFRKIGYGALNPGGAILAYSPTSIQFDCDLNNDHVAEQITYTLSDTTEALASQNPRDMILYRRVNTGTPLDIGRGVVDFHLSYFDANGDTALTAQLIDCIEIRLTVESEYPLKFEGAPYYAQNHWQTRITPPNLLVNN